MSRAPEREDVKHDKGEQKNQQAEKVKKKERVSLWKESEGQILQSVMALQSRKDLGSRGLGWCEGLGVSCEGKTRNTLLLAPGFLLVGGIAGLRFLLSTAPSAQLGAAELRCGRAGAGQPRGCGSAGDKPRRGASRRRGNTGGLHVGDGCHCGITWAQADHRGAEERPEEPGDPSGAKALGRTEAERAGDTSGTRAGTSWFKLGTSQVLCDSCRLVLINQKASELNAEFGVLLPVGGRFPLPTSCSRRPSLPPPSLGSRHLSAALPAPRAKVPRKLTPALPRRSGSRRSSAGSAPAPPATHPSPASGADSVLN